MISDADAREMVERELAALRGTAPETHKIANELTRELGYRRRVYPQLVAKGTVTFKKAAEQIWIVEYLVGEWQRRRVRQREEQST